MTPLSPPRHGTVCNPEGMDTAAPTLLVTAFDPFDGQSINPAQQVLERLPDTLGIGEAEVRLDTLVVPTEFGASIARTTERIAQVRPFAVVCLGQAGGRAAITPERVAINVDDARIPDNAGARPVDTPVVPGGPAAYFSTLPIKAMAQAMRDAGYPAAVSNTAGTFVCNHLMYGVAHFLAQGGEDLAGDDFAGDDLANAQSGFIHVPYIPEQGQDGPALPLADVASAIEVALRVVAERALSGRGDDVRSEGLTH